MNAARLRLLLLLAALLVSLAALYHYTVSASRAAVRVYTGYANGYCMASLHGVYCSVYIDLDRALLLRTVILRLGETGTNITLPWGGIYIKKDASIMITLGGRGRGLLQVSPSRGPIIELEFNATGLLEALESLHPVLVRAYKLRIPPGSLSLLDLGGLEPSSRESYYLAVDSLEKAPHGLLHLKLFRGQDTLSWEHLSRGGGFLAPLGGLLVGGAPPYTRAVIQYLSEDREPAELVAKLYATTPLVLGLVDPEGGKAEAVVPVAVAGEPS